MILLQLCNFLSFFRSIDPNRVKKELKVSFHRKLENYTPECFVSFVPLLTQTIKHIVRIIFNFLQIITVKQIEIGIKYKIKYGETFLDQRNYCIVCVSDGKKSLYGRMNADLFLFETKYFYYYEFLRNKMSLSWWWWWWWRLFLKRKIGFRVESHQTTPKQAIQPTYTVYVIKKFLKVI